MHSLFEMGTKAKNWKIVGATWGILIDENRWVFNRWMGATSDPHGRQLGTQDV